MSVAFSPCGETIASASADCNINLWDAETGAFKRTLQGHTMRVASVAFSPCGETIVSASFDCKINLWDAGTGALKRTLEGHTRSVTSVAFSPCGETIASASSDCYIKLWDAVTCELRDTLEGHDLYVTSVAFQPLTIDMAATALADVASALYRRPSDYGVDYDTLNVAVSGFLLDTISHHPHNDVVQMAKAINHHRMSLEAKSEKVETKKRKDGPIESDPGGQDSKRSKGPESYRNVRKQQCVRCRARLSRAGQCKLR